MRFDSSLVTKYGITSGKVINCWHGGSPIVKVTKITVFGGDLVIDVIESLYGTITEESSNLSTSTNQYIR